MHRGLSQFVWCVFIPFVALTLGVLICYTIGQYIWMSKGAVVTVLIFSIIAGVIAGRLIFRLMRRKFSNMTPHQRTVCLLIEIPTMAATCVGAWLLMENIFSRP